jgi:hypothetical protein
MLGFFAPPAPAVWALVAVAPNIKKLESARTAREQPRTNLEQIIHPSLRLLDFFPIRLFAPRLFNHRICRFAAQQGIQPTSAPLSGLPIATGSLLAMLEQQRIMGEQSSCAHQECNCRLRQVVRKPSRCYFSRTEKGKCGPERRPGSRKPKRLRVASTTSGSSPWLERRPVDLPDATFDGRSASYNCDRGTTRRLSSTYENPLLHNS